MEDALTFEEAAKKSWQSFSTMKRFVSEANRLENASWRLWFMQRQQETTHTRCCNGNANGNGNGNGNGNHGTRNSSNPSSPPHKPIKQRCSASANANCCVPCVYCEIQRASLSCHGCCHDAYCVSCFKLIHKRGNLATHTAMKIDEFHASTLPSAGGNSQHLVPGVFSHNKSSRSSNESSESDLVNGNGLDSFGDTGKHAIEQSRRPHQVMNEDQDDDAVDDEEIRLNGNGSTRPNSGENNSKKLWNKPWEVQMDLLIQRLMMNSLPSDGDISVRNIDSRQELLEFDHDINSVEHSPAGLQPKSPPTSSGKHDPLLSTLLGGSTPPRPAPNSSNAKRLVCANCKEAHKTIDCPSLMQESDISSFVLPPPVTKDSTVSHIQQLQAPKPLFSPALESLFSRPKSHSTPSMHASSASATPIQIAVTSKTSRKKKTMVCANCQGNHMTIECALLENSMSPTGNTNVDTMLRKCFTTLHNDHSSNSTHAFLGDEISVHGSGNFGVAMARGADIRKLDEYPGSSSMMPIREDAIDLPEEAQLIALSSADSKSTLHATKWSRDSWLLSCLATELPTDVFVQLRKLHDQCRNECHDHDHDFLEGWVHMSSSKREWHRRFVRLHRNMLWEFLDDQETTRPLGLANVNEAIIDVDQLDVCVKFFQRASTDLQRRDCFMRFDSTQNAQEWKARLDQASHLSIEHLFNLSPDGQSTSYSCAYDDVSTDAYELGKGRFSSVRRASRRNSRCPVPCALKIIDKLEFWNLVENETERDDTLVREILTQSVLTMRCGSSYCPVIRLQSLLETRQYLVLELELMQEGDLHEEIVTTNAIDEYHASFLAASLVHAIAYCQTNLVAHRDIKLSNLALSCGWDLTSHRADGNQINHRVRVLKIADFGMATFIREDGTLRGRCGTPGFVAPEILTAGKGEAYPSGVDMFSAGVVLYTMLCGYEPFFGVTDEELIAVNKTVTYEFDEPEWSDISSEAKDLIAQMMEKDTSRRITTSAALEHPFLRDASAQLERLLVHKSEDLDMCQIELL